jgi:hypothetical protein
MLLKDKHIRTFFAAVLLLASSAALMAAPAEKEGHLIITEVSVDYGTSSMVIIGYDLDFGDGPLAVILGDTDITADCALDDPEADPQTITCVDLVLPVAADLLLVVSNGNGAPQIDEYDLTFGAVGPPGPQGPPGIIGFYKVRVQETVTADEAMFGGVREGNCDAGDFPISVGWFANAGNMIDGMSLSEMAGGAASVFVRNLNEGSAFGVGINCADFSPAHEEP